MLSKLLKYEFKAMGRILLPIFGAGILLAAFSALSNNMFLKDQAMNFNVFRIISVLLIIAYIMIITAAVVLSYIISISRFKKGILGQEGYLTNVLPVTSYQNIFCKLITSCVYQILGFITAMISVLIFVCIVQKGFHIEWKYFMSEISLLFKQHGGEIMAYSAEGIVFCLLSLIQINLMLYASIATGHSFNNKKVLKSVCAFIVFYFVSQIINAGLINLAMYLGIDDASFTPHFYMFLLIVLQAFYCAVYFVITNYNLKKRLNLE